MASVTPFDRVVAALEELGTNPRERTSSTRSVRARCPAHEDTNPSLVVTQGRKGVVLRCFGGCPVGKVLRVLGIKQAELFDDEVRGERVIRQIIATYPYSPTVEKVRYAPKAFRWRHLVDGTWRPGQPPGFVAGLYRLADVATATRLYVVEGERAVEHLRGLGVPATCPPAGASTWTAAHTVALYEQTAAQELAILPDRDQPGRTHARRVAAEVHRYRPATHGGIEIRIVTLPIPVVGGDVVDFLLAGKTVADLDALTDATPIWHPDLDRQQLLEKRRQQTRERVRRKRARDRAALAGNAPNVTDSPATCNAPNVTSDPVTHRTSIEPGVTRNAVTHPERSSRSVTRSYPDREITGCCEGGDLRPKCKLCETSPTYWRRGAA